jgi:hypothetical protein
MSEQESRHTNRVASFDELAKGLAGGTVSRGKALRWLGAALFGGAVASIPGVAFAAPCRSPRIRCSGQCCAEGVTTCQGTGRNKTCGPAPVVCPPGQDVCGGQCLDTSTDLANCGACGNACGLSQSCVDGQCQCPPGTSFCTGIGCVDTNCPTPLDPTTCQCDCPPGHPPCGAGSSCCAPGQVCTSYGGSSELCFTPPTQTATCNQSSDCPNPGEVCCVGVVDN